MQEWLTLMEASKLLLVRKIEPRKKLILRKSKLPIFTYMSAGMGKIMNIKKGYFNTNIWARELHDRDRSFGNSFDIGYWKRSSILFLTVTAQFYFYTRRLQLFL